MSILLIWVMVLLFVLVYFKRTAVVAEKKDKEVMACAGSSNEKAAADIVYIAHSSKKYHRSGCHFILEEEMPIEREAAKKQGYISCKVCNPN